jgi:hypothetical protein
MFNISTFQYIIIIILILLIVGYSIFAYSYVFNKVDIIHYKMKIANQNNEPNIYSLVKSINNDLSLYVEYAKGELINIICKLFSNIIKTVQNIQTTYKNLKEDFIIYI